MDYAGGSHTDTADRLEDRREKQLFIQTAGACSFMVFVSVCHGVYSKPLLSGACGTQQNVKCGKSYIPDPVSDQ